MGEVKIKSGNLFDTSIYNNDVYLHNCTVTNTSTSVTITSTGTDPFVGFVNSPGTTVPERAQSMYIPVKPNTAYTIDMSSAPKCYCTQVDDSNVIKKGVQINLLPYRFTTDDSTTYVIIRLGDDTLQTGDSLTFESIQLLEGTYTSETIPEYQPYFLNRPAHQFVNGQWIDIPTHHYTNGRWQGELTSQSPLEFRATGQSLLDWRIDGALGGVGDWDETEQRYKIPVRVESENLFDINGEHTSTGWDGKECLVIENDAIVVNQIRPGYMTGIYYDKVYTPGTYTFTMKQLATQSNRTEIRVVSSAPFVGGDYNKSYKAYTAPLVKHGNTHYITIIVTEPTEIGFFINGYFSVNDKIHDIQLLEGTYTASTIPPYEVNLFTDHQLLDGDSIDFATDQTAIPIATGNNILTVDTAVKPSKVFIKFEG